MQAASQALKQAGKNRASARTTDRALNCKGMRALQEMQNDGQQPDDMFCKTWLNAFGKGPA